MASWAPELRRAWSAAAGGATREIIASPRGGRVAAVTGRALLVFDGPPGFAPRHELRAPGGGAAGLTAAAFSAKGTEAITGSPDGFLHWWQLETGEQLCSAPLPAAAAGSAGGSDGGGAGAPAGAACIAASKAGYVAAASGGLLAVFGPGGEHLHTLDGAAATGGAAPLRFVAWLDAHTVVAAGGAGAAAWRVDDEAAVPAGAFGTNPAGAVAHAALSPDGRFLAAAAANGTLQVWDAAQAPGGGADPVVVIADVGLDGGAPVAALSWDAGSRLLAAAVGAEALVWDIAAAAGAEGGAVGAPVSCGGLEAGCLVTRVAFQPNGTLLVRAAEGVSCRCPLAF